MGAALALWARRSSWVRRGHARPHDHTHRCSDDPAASSWRWADRPAASKWGTDDRGALLDEISLDVMIDLGAAFPAAVAALSPADEESLRATILAAAAAALA